jgi:hypothetical protein
MLFKKEDLRDLAWGDYNPDIFNIVSDKIIDTSRWSIIYEMVFGYQDKFYVTSYSEGATERQDESPYEDEEDEIECKEVFPREVKVIKYFTSP